MLNRVSTRKLVTMGAATMAAGATLTNSRRCLGYFLHGVTGRTQPYAQGDMLPRTDNTKIPVDKPSAAAASLTGNQCSIAYDSSNIFNVEGFSPLEGAHYVSLRGVSKHKIEPLPENEGAAAASLMRELLDPEVEASLEYLWWMQMAKDFPSLKKRLTPPFKKEWQDFYIAALEVAHDDAAVTALARPFMEKQRTIYYIGQPMVWRLAERLGDALERAPRVSRYEVRVSRVAVERVTKLLLDTIADEPWAHQDTTNPLEADITNFRAWHEAGNW